MSFIPPVDKSTKSVPTRSVSSEPANPKKDIEETVTHAAREKLTPPTGTDKPKTGWKIWSWLGLGPSAEKGPAVPPPAASHKTEVEKREENASSQTREESIYDDFDEEDLDDGVGDDEIEDEMGMDVPGPADELDLEVASERPIESALSTEKREQTEATAVKTYQTSKKTRWERVKERLPGVAASIPGLGRYIKSYDTFNKARVVADQKQVMLRQLNDPQFVEFYEVASHSLLPMINEKLVQALEGKTDSVSRMIASQRPLILKLLEVILARGFANLAGQVRENEDLIANFDEQPSLVSVISLLCQKGGEHIDREQLAKLEKKYRENQSDLLLRKQLLFPDIEKDFEKKQVLQKYIHEYIHSTDKARKNVIKHELFPDFDRLTGKKATDVEAFFINLNALHQKNLETKLLFGQVSDGILSCFFPNKLADIEELKGWGSYLFGNLAYDAIKSFVAGILQETYESFENDTVRNEAWERDLQSRLGAPDLKPVVEAPAALLTAFAKNYIQSDPGIMEIAATALDKVMNPDASRIVAASAPDEQRQLLSKLSQEQLANWIVESAQKVLHTEDPHLAGLGHFIKQSLNNLTLALMAKGAKLVIEEEDEVEPTEFIKEFTERLVAKMGSLSSEAIPDRFWKDFVVDLPIPAQMKEALVPVLIDKANVLQAELRKKAPDFQEIQRMNAEVERKIRSYEGGEQLLSITEKVSDKIVEQMLEKNIGLITTMGLGDSIDELFAQYLPGVVIQDDLKDWFKNNISALGATEEGHSPQSVILLKQGIQAILRKAMVNAIEKNFRGESKDYAVQLLKNFQQAFSKVFAEFDEEQKAEINLALNIQAQIEEKNARIKAIKAEVDKKPTGISPDQNSLIEDVINANMRYIRASNYVDNLSKKRDEILAALNEEYDEESGWNADELNVVNEALVLRKVEVHTSLADQVSTLKREIAIYEGIEEELTADQEKDLAQRQVLLALLEMSPDELKMISEAVNIQMTLQHAEKELEFLKVDLDTKEEVVANYDQEKIKNKTAWVKAQQWMHQVLKSRQEINQLSQENAFLETELDQHLKVFQDLAGELTGLLGLDRKEALELPPFLQDKVWPLIESAKNKNISRLLFGQLTPFLMSIADIQKNKDRLRALSNGNPFLGEIIHAISEEAVSRIPELVTSQKSLEDIARVLNDVIPGATDLHAFVAPQLEVLLEGEDPALEANRELLQQSLEGTVLRVLVKIAEANQAKNPGEDVLTVMTQKLKNLALKAQPIKGQPIEEAAHNMIDRVLENVLGLTSERQLDSLPLAMQKIAFEKIREQAYQQLTPLVLPIIERNQSRAELQKKSGSPFLGNICEALSKDVFAVLPNLVKSHRIIAQEVFVILSDGQQPTPTQIDQFAKEISGMVNLKNVKNHLIVEAYAKVAMKTLTPEEQDDLENRLDENKVKDNIKNIVMTPEAIASAIGESMPHLDERLQLALANELQRLIREDSDVYQNGYDFASAYVEGVFLKLFIGIAEKNPKQKGKDTLIVLTERLLAVIAEKYQDAKDGKNIAEVIQELNDAIMGDVLGIDSPEAFKGLPDPLKAKAYEAVKDQLGKKLLRFQANFADFELQVQGAKEKVKDFGVAANATKGYAQILAEDVAQLVVNSVPQVLTEIDEKGMKGVVDVSKGLKDYLEQLADGNIAIANVLLNYTKGAQFKQILGNQLNQLADKDQLLDDKQKAADLLSDLLLPTLSQVIERAIHFEDTHKKQFNQKLVANLLHVGAQHLKHLNTANALAIANGRKDISHADFVEAAGAELHPGVPTGDQEIDPRFQRQKFAYGPAAKGIMKMIFPNGKRDLTFVPEELRGPLWKMMKKNVFPQMLPIITETLFDPMMINSAVLDVLKSMRESLEGPIVLDTPEPADLPLDELDEASGELIVEALKALTMPAWVKNKIVDPKTGEVSPAMKKKVGASLRKQFNDTFIQDKLKKGLEQAVKRDASGKPILKIDTRSKAVKDSEAPMKAAKLQEELKKVSREVVNASISNVIRGSWVAAQARFDALVAKLFGKIGKKLKQGLDAVFRFVFFKLVGSILSIVFWPVKEIVKQIIYRMISLDQNRDAILAMFTRVPEDQPMTGGKHAVYNENLVFQMGEAFNRVVQDLIEKEPVVDQG